MEVNVEDFHVTVVLQMWTNFFEKLPYHVLMIAESICIMTMQGGALVMHEMRIRKCKSLVFGGWKMYQVNQSSCGFLYITSNIVWCVQCM